MHENHGQDTLKVLIKTKEYSPLLLAKNVIHPDPNRYFLEQNTYSNQI